MSYTSNYNLNQRVSYLESEISKIAPIPPGGYNLANVLTIGNSAGSNDIDLNSQDILQVNNIDLQTINGQPYPQPQSVYPNTFYVSKSGNDTTGDGSFAKPYLTIQKAITEGEALALGQNGFLVWVDFGEYTENLSITSTLMISGMRPINPNWLFQVSNPAPQTQITGTISFTNTSGQQSRVYLNEIRINGHLVGTTTIDPSSTNDLFNTYLTNVWLFSQANDNLPLISLENSSGAVGRFTLANCNISKTVTNTSIPIDIAQGTNGIIMTANNTRFQLKYDGTDCIFNLDRMYNFINCEFDLTSNNSFNYSVIKVKRTINERAVIDNCQFWVRNDAKGANYNIVEQSSASTSTTSYSFTNSVVIGDGFVAGTNGFFNNKSTATAQIEYFGVQMSQDLAGQYFLNTGGGTTTFTQKGVQAHDIEMGGCSITSCLELEGTSGNDLTISSLNDLVLSCDTSGVGGEIKLLGGTGLLSGTAGGSSGQHLVITINGTQYKILLENP